MPNVSACSSCGRAIYWAASPNGARLPLDARPVTVYHINEQYDPPRAERMGDPLEGHVYISHWLTCKNPPGRK